MPEFIFTTVHGSRLYGFDHAGSDRDTYTVLSDRRARLTQSVHPSGLDAVVVGLDRFVDLANGGSHQSAEALFSRRKVWGDNDAAQAFRPYLDSLRVSGADVFTKYERTIRKFCYGDLKRRRHAVRLAWNLSDLRRSGRFNPTLTQAQVAEATQAATNMHGDSLVAHLLHTETSP